MVYNRWTRRIRSDICDVKHSWRYGETRETADRSKRVFHFCCQLLEWGSAPHLVQARHEAGFQTVDLCSERVVLAQRSDVGAGI